VLARALSNNPLQLTAAGLRIPDSLSQRGGAQLARAAAAKRRFVEAVGKALKGL